MIDFFKIPTLTAAVQTKYKKNQMFIFESNSGYTAKKQKQKKIDQKSCKFFTSSR